MLIRAAVVERKGGTFNIQELELDDELRGKEILVRIVACAVCHSDLMVRDQGMPFPLPGVPGHEGTGVVERVGPHVESIHVGDHVLMTFPNDGTCENCLQGRPRWCLSGKELMMSGRRYDGSGSALSRNGKALGGHFFQQSAFATHVIATEMNAVVVAAGTPLDLFILGCGIMTGAGGVLNALQPKPGTAIVVLGAGPVGSAAIMAARLAGCGQIIAVEPHATRRENATVIGATHVLDPRRDDVAGQVKRITGSGAHYVLVCVGNLEAINGAPNLLRSGGVCGVIGDPGAGIDAKYEVAQLVTFGRTIHGIVGGEAVAPAFLPRLIEAHERGQFPLEKLIRRYKFSNINDAIHDFESGATIKPVLMMDANN